MTKLLLRSQGSAEFKDFVTYPKLTREMIKLYHWRGLTLREISFRYGINESRVAQIHKHALGLMAVSLREQGIAGLASVLPAWQKLPVQTTQRQNSALVN